MDNIITSSNQIMSTFKHLLNDANESLLTGMEYIREFICSCGVQAIHRRSDWTSLLALIAVLVMAFAATTSLIVYLIYKLKCFVYRTVDVRQSAAHSSQISANSASLQTSSESQSHTISTATQHNTHQTQAQPSLSSTDKSINRSNSSDNLNIASPTEPIVDLNSIPVSKPLKDAKQISNSSSNVCESSINTDTAHTSDIPLITESKHLFKSNCLNKNPILDNDMCESLESLESIAAIDSSDSSVDIPDIVRTNSNNNDNDRNDQFDHKTRDSSLINRNSEHLEPNKTTTDEYFECSDNKQNGDGMLHVMHVSHNTNHFEFELSSTETGDEKEDKQFDVNVTVHNGNEDSSKKAITPDTSVLNDESRGPSPCSSKSDQTFQSSSKESRSLLKSIRKRMSFNKNRPIKYSNHETLPKDNNENASIELSSKKKSFRQSFNSLNAFQSSSSASKDRSILRSIRKRMSFNKNRPITDANCESVPKDNNENATTEET